MASTITHAYFIMDVYEKLDSKTKNFLCYKKNFLKTTAQNMDVLFFYNITNLKKGKKIRDFGHYFHQHEVYNFFETLIHYIKLKKYYDDSSVMAYLYGMLSHYVLDSTMHPYVIYKTGVFKRDDRKTYKYNHLHGRLETYFDNYLILTRENINPVKFKCYDFFETCSFNDKLNDIIDFSYKQVFNINNMSKIYKQAISNMRFFYREIRYDPCAIKVNFYRFIDLFKTRKYLKLDILSYNQKVDLKSDYLNLDHKKWCNPTDKKIVSNLSLIDLYQDSIIKTVWIINKINEYFYDNKDIDLKSVIKNNSYVTGRDCDIMRELKYFEF